MDNKVTNIKERVLLIPEYKGISKEKFFEEIGVSYGNFKGKSKNKSLSSDVLATIATKHDDINPAWILTGEGEMDLNSVKNSDVNVKGEKPYLKDEKTPASLNEGESAAIDYKKGSLEKELSKLVASEISPLSSTLDGIKNDISAILQIAQAQQVFNEAVLKGIDTKKVK